MDKPTAVETTPQQSTDYEAAIERYIAGIHRLREDMAASQQRIERFRAQTRATLEATRVVLDELAVGQRSHNS